MPADYGPARVRVPLGMAERAREFAAGGLSPAVPRDAATVILLRQAPVVEVFMLVRTTVLEFAPGACVFPGGAVDERDADPAIGERAWAGPAPATFAGQLGVSADHARALVCAAVRETFEESGVLLAGPSPAELVQPSEAMAADRRALLDGSLSLAGLLARRDLVLRADLLTPWARWITPEVSARRFDTWFFAAALPAGQTAALEGPQTTRDPGESDSGTWLRPVKALEAARSGQITLLPPTAVTLAELGAYQDLDEILAARRVIAPLLPKVVLQDERAWLALPRTVEYPL
jgi:8-oxo-dGTP pyrophosphatase MutT (NUDIX family)